MSAEIKGLGDAPLPPQAYRMLVDAALDIIAVFDPDGRIRFINRAVTRVLGHEPAAVTGFLVIDYIHPDDRARALERLAAVTSGQSSERRTSVYRMRASDGSYRHIEALSSNHLAEPSLRGICMVGRDVTARVVEESERAAVEERRRLAARVARLGIWEWDPVTDEVVAEEVVRELARPRPGQQWRGSREFLERFLPEDREVLERELRRAAAGHGECRATARMPMPDGTLRWLYVHAQRMQPDTSPTPRVLGLIMDITGQKRAEQEISRHGELLELACWGADLGVWTWFPAEDRAILDDRSARLIGRPPGTGERTTADCNSTVHPDDLPELTRREVAMVSGATDVFDYAYRVQREPGTWNWVLDRGRVTERDASGRAIRVSGVTLAIDDAKRQERELDEQRLRLDLALRASRLGLWDHDLVTNELYVDQRYTDITGLPAEVVRRHHRTFDERIHEEDRPRLVAAARACYSGRSRILSFEGRLLGPDGRLVWIQLEGFVAHEQPGGLPARLVGTIADITDRQRNRQLTTMGERVAELGSYEFDIGQDRFFWSEGIYRIFELPADFAPVRGTTQHMLLPASRSLMLAAFRAARDDGRPFDLELEAETARGRRIWIRNIGRVETFRDRPVRISGIVQDITERKKLESDLLEAANREQQKLGSDLHDGLGQELTGISLLLQGLAQQARESNPALTQPFDRLSTLLSGAIRSTRALAHGLAPVSLGRGGLEGALRILAEQSSDAYAMQVRLELELAESGAFGEVAGNHLYRIAQEALSNAARHGRASAVTLRLASASGWVTLEVEDNGCGIDELAAPTTGMGLRSMAYRARSLSGTLTVERRGEGGTRVRVTCPVSAA